MNIALEWSESVFYNTDKDILDHYCKDSLRTLYILGKGFDPRMMVGLHLISGAVKDYEVMLIDFASTNTYSNKTNEKLVLENMNMLTAIAPRYTELQIPEDTSNLPLFFKNKLLVSDVFRRVIIDISAMPQSIYFNIIKQLIRFAKQYNIKLDIAVCENSALDDAIKPTDLQDANYLIGFNAYSNDLESDENRISIWFPLIGINCKFELEKMQSFLMPEQICPILPFPSRNPRRSEEILFELDEGLYTHLEIDKKNIMYVDEQNVMDIYYKLHNTIRYYHNVFKDINAPRFYISTGSSKLIGLGALLVHLDLALGHESRVSFAHVDNKGYNMEISDYKRSHNQVCLLCLEDNRYEW